jgi:hypothetical protein
MRVHVPRLFLGGDEDLPVDRIERLAAIDRFRVHQLTADTSSADIHLFPQCHMLPTDWRLTTIRDHPLTQNCWGRVFVYNERYRPWCVLPGVYVSMPAGRFEPSFQRPWGYYADPAAKPLSPRSREAPEPDLLFSFIGKTASHRCRRHLAELQHPESVVEDIPDFSPYATSDPNYAARRRRYSDVLARSRFVLCPRGLATSSYRLYEALEAGRVPVIIADDWVAPEGMDWDSFSVRWPEGSLGGLIETIEERNTEWASMSAAATAAYCDFFAPDTAFHRLVELCRGLADSPELSNFPMAGIRRQAFFAAGADVARWRTTTTIRHTGRRVLEAVGLWKR